MNPVAKGSLAPWLVRLLIGGLLIVELVPIFTSGSLSWPLPLRHTGSELVELRLLAAGGAYDTTLLPLPGWLYLLFGAGLAKILPLGLAHKLLLGIAVVGSTLSGLWFGKRLGRPLAGLLGAALACYTCVLAFGLTAHLLSLIPFWWGAGELVKQLDHPERAARSPLAIALLLCASLSAASFVVLAVAVLATLRRARLGLSLLALAPAALLFAGGLLAATNHAELVTPGDPWQFVWIGNWPILRDLYGGLFEGVRPALARLLFWLVALSVLLGGVLSRPPADATAASVRVPRVLLVASLFLFFYLPRSAVEPLPIEAIAMRLVCLILPLGLLRVGNLTDWRQLALLPAAVAAVIAPLAFRAALWSSRPLAVFALAQETSEGALVCALADEPRRPGQSVLDVEGRGESGALWAFVARGGPIPQARRYASALAILPQKAPVPPRFGKLAVEGLQSGDSCDDYLVMNPPPILERDPSIAHRGERGAWIHFHRVHPRPESP